MFNLFKKKTVVTHNGGFHADDVFACAALSILEKGKIKIIRTRDPKIIEKGDYVVDVGGIYSPAANRFDHHQKGGAGLRDNSIHYASFGLVWKHYGEKLCGSKEVAEEIDARLVQPIDAEDNGIKIYSEVVKDVHPYAVFDALESFILPNMNDKDLHTAFLKVSGIAGEIIKNNISKIKYRISKEKDILDIYNKTTDKRVIIFDEGMPWQNTLSKFQEPLFVVSPDKKNDWVVIAVRDDAKSFKNRKDLPAHWAGLRDADLAKTTGVPDAVFCHNNLFIAVAKSKEGAIELAKIALNDRT